MTVAEQVAHWKASTAQVQCPAGCNPLSLSACRKRQLSRPRYQLRYCNSNKHGYIINPVFVLCTKCAHWLSDAELVEAGGLLKKPKKLWRAM